MELTLKRLYDDKKATSGHLYVNGSLFCITLEDTFRHEKIRGVTRIPAGRFEITVRREGGMYPRYKEKYGTDGMLWIRNVPLFDWIYIHIGNDADDSEGCILVGDKLSQDTDQNGNITQTCLTSISTYQKLHKLITGSNDKVFITIIDN